VRAWHPDDEQTRALRLLVEHRRRVVGDRTRISNRMTSLLKCYLPQVLEWFPDIRTELVCNFLRHWPSLDALKRVRRETLLQFFRQHNSVRQDTLEKRINSIKEAQPLTTDGAVLSSSILMLKALCSQMKATLTNIKEFDREIEALCTVHQDYKLFQ
jgi:transposase